MGKNEIAKTAPVLHLITGNDDEEIAEILEMCNKQQQKALIGALRSAYEAGQDAADQRTGKLIARIFGGFVGVTPGIDMNEQEDKTPRQRLRHIVRLLAVAGRGT